MCGPRSRLPQLRLRKTYRSPNCPSSGDHQARRESAERLLAELSALGHDVDTVRAEQLAGRDDNDVWRGAQSADRFLITQDLDFSDVRRYAPGTHAGLLLVRLAQPGRDALLARVAMLFATEPVHQWRGCLVVATDHKVRVKRPA